jgi:hypothetical protein
MVALLWLLLLRLLLSVCMSTARQSSSACCSQWCSLLHCCWSRMFTGLVLWLFAVCQQPYVCATAAAKFAGQGMMCRHSAAQNQFCCSARALLPNNTQRSGWEHIIYAHRC